jgi:hypothetical protein
LISIVTPFLTVVSPANQQSGDGDRYEAQPSQVLIRRAGISNNIRGEQRS